MIKAATISIGLICLVSVPWTSAAQNATQEAVNEAVYRQANRITLRQKLAEASSAQARHDLPVAAKLYDESWELVQRIGAGVDAEADATRKGLAEVRLELAKDAQRNGDLKEAAIQVDDVLRVDPSNAKALDFKRENDKRLVEERGHTPSDEAKAQIPAIMDEKAKANTLVQDGKMFLEMGKLEEAEAKLRAAVKIDPQNQGAYYYMNIVREARYKEALNKRDVTSREGLVEVEQAWATPPKRELLPVPNPYSRSNIIYTSKGRQAIFSKLERIHLDEVGWDGLPLGEVVKSLSDQAKKRDPEKRGLNFILNPNIDQGATASAATVITDPNTGLPVTQAAPAEAVDMSAISIKLNPPLVDVRLADVLDAIVKVADRPIKYSIEDYAIVFSLKGREATPLYIRSFKVDPNTFYEGLESVVGFPFGDIQTSSGGGGGGGSSGGSSSSGGGQGGGILTVPRVSLAGGSAGGGGLGGGGGGGGGLGGGGGIGGGGIRGVTRTNLNSSVSQLVIQYFTTLGVDLLPPKTLFFNDREGTLVVKASLTDLDTIETAVQALNIAPPQVNIKAKFVEVSQNDTRALGFDWYLGNWLMRGGAISTMGGTAPAFNGSPTAANPQGFFPGTSAATAPTPSASDQLVTSGLRNSVNAPAVATFTGILTDPQFRVVIRALEQRDGTDLLNEASVTTLSGRQTEIQVVDLITIVTGVSLNQTTTGGGGAVAGTGGAGAVGSSLNYPTQILPFGPTLDVIPYVSADGFTIQMTIIPTITEFLGYDDPGQFVPQAQSVSGGNSGAALPLKAQLPLPHFRLRQVTTSAIVWDGQTVVLGGLITENVTKTKDKIPVIGDLPLVGRLFRSESSQTQKKNLMIFVTPRIIDPSGNNLHTDDEMPFAASAIPAQPKPTPPAAQ